MKEKIFNLYFTTKPTGSGIGLAMTFRIVQLLNGSIDFSTAAGVGTTFRLRFPVVELAVPAVVDAPAANQVEQPQQQVVS